MLYKVSLAAGFAAGYVLGSKAGRERYDQIVAVVRDLRENPAVQSAAGILQQHASDLVGSARHASGL